MIEELALKESLDIHWHDVHGIIADAVLNFGKCSRVYLMRKIKCTERQARNLMEHYEEDQFLMRLQAACEGMTRIT